MSHKKATQHAAERCMPLSCGLEITGSYETIKGKYKWYCLHQKRCNSCQFYRFETNPIRCKNELYGKYPTTLTPENINMIRNELMIVYD